MISERSMMPLLGKVPLPVVRVVAERVFEQAMLQHPDLFDRMGIHRGKRFRFIVTDMALRFDIHPSARSIRVHRTSEDMPQVSATVSGRLVALLALLEGRVDGDALFFSRSLSVTGDMEAVLALRNALDNCGFDLPSDLSAMAGPFAPHFRRFAETIRERALAGIA